MEHATLRDLFPNSQIHPPTPPTPSPPTRGLSAKHRLPYTFRAVLLSYRYRLMLQHNLYTKTYFRPIYAPPPPPPFPGIRGTPAFLKEKSLIEKIC